MARSSDLWRLWGRRNASYGMPGRGSCARYRITADVGTLAVGRLRRGAAVTLLLGLGLFAAFDVGVTAGTEVDDPWWITVPGTTALVLSLLLVPAGAIGLVRWSRRLRSVRRHGWRRGHAEISANRWNGSVLTITCGRDVHTVVTTRPVGFPVPITLARSAVYLGGAGNHVTVLFLDVPFLAAAKAIDKVLLLARGRRHGAREARYMR
jgi:hypothetical protein